MQREATRDRPYHHGDLREALVSAAEALIAQGTTDSLTLREVARRAGVSHNAPYGHFASRKDLLSEVAARGFRRLEERLKGAVTPLLDTPRAALLEVGVQYMGFALENPSRFRLMFGAELADYGSSESLRRAAEDAYGVLDIVIDRGTAAGLLRQLPLSKLACWSLMHGLINLTLDQRQSLPRSPEEAMSLARAVGETLVTGLAAAR